MQENNTKIEKFDKIATRIIGIIVVLVVLFYSGKLVLAQIDKKNSEQAIKKEVEQGIVDYENYLKEKGYSTTEDLIIKSQNFLDEMSYSDKAEFRIANYIHGEINNELSMYFPRFFKYNVTFDYPNQLRDIVEKDYITAQNKRDFKTAKIESDKNNARLNELSKMTDDERKQLFERSKKKIKIGDTSTEVIEKRGSPKDRTKSTSINEVLEIWYYDDVIIYIEDGIVYKTVE